jgi:predicted metal-binding membrane protein
MSTAKLRRTPSSRATDAGLVAFLLALAAAAWAVSALRMDGMDAGPGTDLGGLGWFMVVWVTMTAAMMLPATAPRMLGLGRAALVPVLAAHLTVWAAAGLVGYVVVEGVRSMDPGFLAWDDAGRYVAGGAILAAGLYQLTPLKERCLRRCRMPAGLDYGAFCLGCSWALMVALFALGLMSLGWMALIAALIAAERLLPWRAIAARAVAVVLVALGLAVIFAPGDVPGLTIPGSHEAMHEMEAMEQ